MLNSGRIRAVLQVETRTKRPGAELSLADRPYSRNSNWKYGPFAENACLEISLEIWASHGKFGVEIRAEARRGPASFMSER